MEPNLVYVIQAGPYWDWKVAMDLFFGGAGVGALIFGVVYDTAFPGRQQRLCQTAAWLAPLLIVLGLGFLLLELGRPERLFLTYLHFAPTSALWWGGIFQLLLVIGSIAYALTWRDAEAVVPARRTLGWALTPIAIIVGAYHGLLLAAVTARPLWNTGPTVVAALLCFASTGLAAVTLIHLLRAKITGRLADPGVVDEFLRDMVPARNLLVAVLVLQLGTSFLWWLSLNFGSLSDQQALAAANASYGTVFWWFGIVPGLVLPLGLGGYAVWRGGADHRTRQVSVIGVMCALILIGGLFFRLAVVLGGQAALPVQGLS